AQLRAGHVVRHVDRAELHARLRLESDVARADLETVSLLDEVHGANLGDSVKAFRAVAQAADLKQAAESFGVVRESADLHDAREFAARAVHRADLRDAVEVAVGPVHDTELPDAGESRLVAIAASIVVHELGARRVGHTDLREREVRSARI